MCSLWEWAVQNKLNWIELNWIELNPRFDERVELHHYFWNNMESEQGGNSLLVLSTLTKSIADQINFSPFTIKVFCKACVIYLSSPCCVKKPQVWNSGRMTTDGLGCECLPLSVSQRRKHRQCRQCVCWRECLSNNALDCVLAHVSDRGRNLEYVLEKELLCFYFYIFGWNSQSQSI